MKAGLLTVLAGLAWMWAAGALGAAPAPAASAAVLAGDWDGTLHVGAMNLRLALHVKAEAGSVSGTLDSIDQGVNGLAASGITLTGGKVRFAVNPPGGLFEGALSPDHRTIAGAWTQNGSSLPLTFTRRPAGTPQASPARPQEPAAPFPYDAIEVQFPSPKAHADLAGTLTVPRGPGRFPAVVLIAGSGPNTRDEVVAGHRPFLIIADYLTRRGIAVLRYDKRGIGASGGDYAHATTVDFADDAAAAVAFLRARPDIEAAHIGLVGHSEGGLIAPIVSAKDPAIAFVVLMAAPGVDGAAILKLQGAAIARAAGADEASVARTLALDDRLFAVIEAAHGSEEAAAKAAAVLAADPASAGATAAARRAQAAAMATDWFRFFLGYDPVPALRAMRCPVLVLSGSKDLQVPPDANLPPIRAALAANRQASVVELPGLNHLFQGAGSGSPSEYAQIEQTLSPPVLALIADWIGRYDK